MMQLHGETSWQNGIPNLQKGDLIYEKKIPPSRKCIFQWKRLLNRVSSKYPVTVKQDKFPHTISPLEPKFGDDGLLYLAM